MTRILMRAFPLVSAIIVSLAGCDRKPSVNVPASNTTSRDENVWTENLPASDAGAAEFLNGLVQDHHLNAHQKASWIIFDPSGVGLSATLQPPAPHSAGSISVRQLNFRMRLSSGRVVTQEVVGWGQDDAAARASAEVSFTLGTFHALLGAFVDPEEEHVVSEHRIIDGKERIVTLGDIVSKSIPQPGSKETSDPIDQKAWSDAFFSALDRAPLPLGTHTVDVYNGITSSGQELEIQKDGARWTEMENQMRSAPWPRGGLLTSVRRFMIIQDLNDPTRPSIPAKPKTTQPVKHLD